MKSLSVTIQMKANEQYFPVVLFVMLYKVVLTFESVDAILKCDHSNESYWAVLSCGAVHYAVQNSSHFCLGLWMNSLSVTIQTNGGQGTWRSRSIFWLLGDIQTKTLTLESVLKS